MKWRYQVLFWVGVSLFSVALALAGWGLFEMQSVLALKSQSAQMQEQLHSLVENLQESDILFLLSRRDPEEASTVKMQKLVAQAHALAVRLTKNPTVTEPIRRELVELEKSIRGKLSTEDEYTLSGGVFEKPVVKKVTTIRDDLVLTDQVQARIARIDRLLNENLVKQQQGVDTFFYVNVLTISLSVTIAFTLFLLFAHLVNDENKRRSALEIELRRAERAAVSASALKSEFLATVSHEVRTPLNGLLGMSELMRSKATGQMQEWAQVIYDSGQSLLKIVNQLLDFARIEAGRLELELQDVDIRETLSRVVQVYQSQASAKNLDLRLEVAEDVSGFFVTDGLRVSQVVHNLVSNAIKYTHHGHVLVRLSSLSKDDAKWRLQLQVEDTGPGLSPEQQKTIFLPFVQGTKAHQQQGTGLGLAIAQAYVDLLGGELLVQSSLGVGSKFTFRWSARRQVKSTLSHAQQNKPEDVLPPKPAVFSVSQDQAVVLLVEDNPTNQMLTQLQLNQLGYSAVVVGSGEGALEWLQSHAADVVLMDCRMPGMDGFECARQWRKMEASWQFSRRPVLALTANASLADQEKARTSGMDEVLLKPMELEPLKRTLERWLSPSLDDAVLLSLKKTHGTEVVQKLLASFVQTLKSFLSELAKIDTHADLAKFKSLGHHLRPSAQAVGALELSRLCQLAEIFDPNQTKTTVPVAALRAELIRSGRRVLKDLTQV